MHITILLYHGNENRVARWAATSFHLIAGAVGCGLGNYIKSLTISSHKTAG